MKKSRLGNSALEISEIGFGCMSLKASEKENIELLHEAVAKEINFFDTADLYDKGLNETIVGKALKGNRNNIIIATKVGNEWNEDGSGWNWNPTKKYIINSVEKSLQRLGTDYIDLYQLHGGTIADPIDETIAAFELLKEQGKIRFYGISSIRPNVIQQWVDRSNICSVMMQYSLLDRRPEESVLPLLQQKGIGVLARGSVAQGLLINKPPKPYLTFTADEVNTASKAVEKIAAYSRTKTAVALQFVLNNPAVTSAVVGVRNKAQLQEAIDAANAQQLSITEIEQLTQSIKMSIYEQHR